MPTLHMHYRSLLLQARQAAIRARDDAARPNALTADSISAILLAAAATEAFINEFCEEVLLMHQGNWADLPPAIVECAREVRALEVQRRDVALKYVCGSKKLDGMGIQRGSNTFQNYRRLRRLRDAIMHVRPALNSGHVGTAETEALAKLGLTPPLPAGYGMSWFDRLMYPEVAKWAHDTALALICEFMERVPVRPYYDPFELSRKMLKQHPACW